MHLLYYPLLILFFLGFVLLPGSVGAILCLLLVNFMPQKRKQIVIAVIVLLIAGVVLLIYSSLSSLRTKSLSTDVVEGMIGKVSLATGTLVPSHWISKGLIASSRGDWETTLYFLALVWGNGLFLYLIATWLSKRLYRRGFNRITTGGNLRKRYGGHWLDRLLERVLFFIDPKTRLLIVKDFRTFRRDPSQWMQVVIFCGLMLAYSANIRRMFIGEINWGYQNGISVLNLSVTAFLLCAYTGRFVFPLLSLEGRKFWILGLMPLEREKLLWGKFAFSSVGSLLIAETLVLVSDLMLGMPTIVVVIHVLTVAVLALGLSGLSVGLGALMPNFRETDPSKVAVGFGGTLNLVVGLGYLVLVIGFMAGPWHIMAGLARGANIGTMGIVLSIVGLGAGLILGVAAVVVPLKWGAKNLREMEF